MKNIIKCLAFTLIIFLLGCKTENNLNFVVKNTTIDSGFIRRIEINRGILTMKNFAGDFYVYSWCPVIYNKSKPNLIKNREKLQISDIEAPYKIFKTKNENFFSIIKNADTLKFEIVE